MVKKIELTQGRWAWVDDEDFEKVNKFIWTFSELNGKPYAMRLYKKDDGKYTSQLMHRFVMGENKIPKGLVVDHIDGDGLDNRKENLRICTQGENVTNSVKRRRSKVPFTSQYKGVGFDKRRGTWKAIIRYNKKSIYLGRFKTELEAALAYDRASVKYHGEFANNNGLLKDEGGRTWQK